MTHTAGFEETFHGMWAGEGESLDLRSYLVARIPARIYPPGAVAAYSNYGAALAGYIVQRRSGEPFDRYVRKHILQPLGMPRTTFVQPLPADLAPAMSSRDTCCSGRRVFEAAATGIGGLPTYRPSPRRCAVGVVHSEDSPAAPIFGDTRHARPAIVEQ